MELGPLQKAWIKELREHPERQTTSALGSKSSLGVIKACCLGQALICIKGDEAFDTHGNINDGSTGVLQKSYSLIGLRDEWGKFNVDGFQLEVLGKKYEYLAAMNDSNISWGKIADFIEANPDKVFTHSI